MSGRLSLVVAAYPGYLRWSLRRIGANFMKWWYCWLVEFPWSSWKPSLEGCSALYSRVPPRLTQRLQVDYIDFRTWISADIWRIGVCHWAIDKQRFQILENYLPETITTGLPHLVRHHRRPRGSKKQREPSPISDRARTKAVAEGIHSPSLRTKRIGRSNTLVLGSGVLQLQSSVYATILCSVW